MTIKQIVSAGPFVAGPQDVPGVRPTVVSCESFAVLVEGSIRLQQLDEALANGGLALVATAAGLKIRQIPNFIRKENNDG